MILSLIIIVISLIGGFAHIQFETWFKWLPAIIEIIVIIIFCIQYGKQQTEGVTFGKVFGYGFKVSLVVSVMMVVYTLLSFYVIFPEFTDLSLQQARAAMEAKGTYTEDQIDQGMAMTKEIFTTSTTRHFCFYRIAVF